VIVSEQMQDAVDAQQFDLVLSAVSLRLRLLGGDLRAQYDVTEQTRHRLRLMPAARAAPAAQMRRPQLIHGEREHVCRAWLTHPSLVQVGYRVLADQEDGQFGQWMDAQLVEHMPGHGCKRRLVAGDARFVGDVDAQRVIATARCWPGGTIPREPPAGRPGATIPGTPCWLVPVSRSRSPPTLATGALHVGILRAPEGASRAASGVVPFVGIHNVADQPVPHNIMAGQPGEVNVV
jgi:hypothetical protein